MDYGGMWDQGGSANCYFGNYVNSGGNHPVGGAHVHFAGDHDPVTTWHYYVAEKQNGMGGNIVAGKPPSSWRDTGISGADTFMNPDVEAEFGWAYVVSGNGAAVECRVSSDNGSSWDLFEVTSDGSDPQVLIADDGTVECFFVRGGMVIKSESVDHGTSWVEAGQVGFTSEVNASMDSPFTISREGMVFDKGDGDIYADLFIDTVGVSLSRMELEGSGTIVATMKNSGTSYIDDLDWSISIVGDSPLGRYFGGSALTNWLFRGRILSGGFTGGNTALSLSESEDIASGPVFGIGHVLITITISVDDDVLTESSEDAFLLGGRLFLYYPEE